MNETTGLVILLHAKKTGVVVGADELWPIGSYAKDWAENTVCVPFHGSVTITED